MRPWNAASAVGASGVTPTRWKRATVPDEAQAAESAFSWSSLGRTAKPVTTGMRSWAIWPIRWPRTG